jgi:AraC-like DNA-binding protein
MLLRVVDFAAARGQDAHALCHSAGLRYATLHAPGARVPYTLAERLSERATTLIGDPNIGLHLAHDVRVPRHFDAGVLMLSASATVRVAIERMVRYQRFWGDGERSQLAAANDGITVRYEMPGPTGMMRRHSDECALAELVLGLNMLAADSVNARAVRFRHAAPRERHEHLALFGSGLEFAAAHTEIVFDAATLAIPMRHASEFYAEIFRQQVEHAIAELPSEQTLAHETRAVVRAALPAGNCSLATTARVLGVSARTLQRRLHAEGTSFDELVDALRRELSVAYLDQAINVREIAELLGYTDVRAFHHAFKRWTGSSPGQLRAFRSAQRSETS